MLSHRDLLERAIAEARDRSRQPRSNNGWGFVRHFGDLRVIGRARDRRGARLEIRPRDPGSLQAICYAATLVERQHRRYRRTGVTIQAERGYLVLELQFAN